jgi:hypothetical protein
MLLKNEVQVIAWLATQQVTGDLFLVVGPAPRQNTFCTRSTGRGVNGTLTAAVGSLLSAI